MINIRLICVGTLKENYLRQASAEYEKRLGSLCKLSITEIKEQKLPHNPSPAQIEKALSAEADRILSSIPAQSKIISLCIEGQSMDSVEFASKIEKWALAGQGSITFIIGSSHGLDKKIKDKSSVRLSMSGMTFPHQLARIMLLEQLYRAFQISINSKYHK